MTLGIVGSVVGPVSARTAGATMRTDGVGVDFAIGGLPFRVAISDRAPYERATAPFKKEQFDSAPTVGDQSLAGWWLRGQLSFHRGAGITYYEVLEGEEVLNRFNTSTGVNPRTPGEVSLYPAPVAVNSGVFTALARNRPDRTEDYAAVTAASGAVLVDGATSTTLTLASAGSAHDVAAGAGAVFYATDSGVEAVPATGSTMTLLCAADAAATSKRHVGVWWAKNRIWTVNGDGSWYTAPAAGAAMDSATKLWNSGLASEPRSWSLAAGPNSVFLGRGSQVFEVNVDPDGTVPVLSAGTTVAELPEDETIRGMLYTVGHLVLCTSKGVRVSAVSNGNLVVGPLSLEADASSAVAEGASAVIGATDGVYVVDLAQPVPGGDLVFAWHKRTSLSGEVAAHGTGRVVLTAAGLYSLPDTGALEASGTLTTGFHRFGTLEPKHFHALKARVAGEGSVAISRVMADGSTVNLFTVTQGSDWAQDITLNLSVPQEMVALKFTLNRDGDDPTKGPQLLGYQLKALPAPRRQRLIRVPLLLEDVEQRQPARARGRRGDAWRRLEALEQMEVSGSVFTYQDFRTGEQGQATVESVEFTNSTPPGPQDNGFGGIVSLTLRKVD